MRERTLVQLRLGVARPWGVRSQAEADVVAHGRSGVTRRRATLARRLGSVPHAPTKALVSFDGEKYVALNEAKNILLVLDVCEK
jgi:hypothetical protein